MELRDFAESILFEPDLERKLATPTSPFTDCMPGKAIIKSSLTPARPEILRMQPRREHQQPRNQIPNNFEDPEARGLILHAFANHELLALELMALAILRFPDAPTSFRLGLARTISDEQRHLRLYWQRMVELGVNLGDAPVNRFFWDCLVDMPSPLAFVTRMSLTLEQANLDFASYYQQLFSSLGDHETARILDEVHQDEIGHVKHGVIWFNRWRDQTQTEWDAYKKSLSLPLSPSRAKGPVFDENARHASGLTPDFIQNLKIFNHSKGRPPKLFWFNASWEEECVTAMPSQDKHGSPKNVSSAVAQKVEHDLQALMMFVAKVDDVVWLDKKPTTTHLKTLTDAGFKIPQLVDSIDELGQRLFEKFEPWGMSPRARAFREKLPINFRQSEPNPTLPEYASKVWASQLSPAQHFPQRLCRSELEVKKALFPGWSVIKAPYGASGRNALRIAPNGIEPEQHRWIEKSLKLYGCLIIEPWVNRVADLSVQLDTGNATKPFLAMTRFIADRRGQYIGHILNAPWVGLEAEDIRALYQHQYIKTLHQTAETVATALRHAGHHGPAGFDAFLYRDEGNKLALRPLVEVNARYTMGRIAKAIESQIHPKATALWLHIPRHKLDWPKLLEKHPAQYENGRLSAGSLATNDPSTSQIIQSLIFAGPPCGWITSHDRNDHLSTATAPARAYVPWLHSTSVANIRKWLAGKTDYSRCAFCSGPLAHALELIV